MTLMIDSQKYTQNENLFSTQFQTPSSVHSPDRTIYLPADSETSLPYYSINNMNKINYQFLPSSQSIVPSHFPTPISIILSSTLRPNSDDNVFEDGEQEHIHNHNSKPSFTSRDQVNRTFTNKDRKTFERIDNLPSLRLYNTQRQNEKGRPNQVVIGNKQSSSNFPATQKPAARRMILTSEIQKADPGLDETKAGSTQNAQYIQAPGHIARTTTESAIPIIRLSNEMDLDGSFSYE